jgi:hypothetical protein
MNESGETNISLFFWQINSSNIILDIFGSHSKYLTDTTSVILTVLYVPIFLVSFIGNITALVFLLRNVFRKYRMKTAYIINLVIADLSGMSFF